MEGGRGHGYGILCRYRGDNQVEAIVYNGGRLFKQGKESLPYRMLTFNQS